MTRPQAAVGWLGRWVVVSLLVAVAHAQQGTDEIVLHGHLAPILMGVFTPDGQRAITASSDETARLWDLQSRAEVRQYTGHTGPLFCLALSADGRTLVTGAQDNTLRLWDVPQTKPIFWLAGHEAAASGLARSVDGRSIASVGSDKRLRLWDTTLLASPPDIGQPIDPATLSKQLTAHEHPATAVAFRSDGNLIASADDHGRVVFWSPYLDQPQGQVEGAPVMALAFHANNQQLFVAGSDGLIRIWQLPTPQPRQIEGIAAAIEQLVVMSNQPLAVVATNDRVTRVVNLDTSAIIREFAKRERPVTAIALSPNNAVLAIAEEGGRVVLFNMNNGEEQGAFSAHTGSVQSIQFHGDNQQIFTAGLDRTVRHWRVQDASQPAAEQNQPLLGDLPEGPAALALTPDGARLFVGTADGKIRQLRTGDGAVERTLEGHTAAISELMVAPNSQQLASASRDQTLRIWSATDGSLLHTLKQAAPVASVSVSPNSQRIASIAEDGVVRVFDAASGLPLEEFSGHQSAAARVRWLSDSLTIASASSADATLRIRKTSAVQSFRAHETAVTDMVLYNGGAQTLSCSADGRVVMSDANSGQMAREFAGVAGAPQAIASRIDNQRVAVGTTDAKVFIWNAGNADSLQTLAVDGPVRAIAWSPDNQKLAVGTETNKLFIFGPPLPPQTSRPGNELVEHQQTVTESPATRLVFDRDNRTIWASHASGHLAQWSYAAPTQIRQFNHGGPVYGVTSSRDGKTIVSCSTDQTVRVWDATTGQQRFQMNGHQGAVHAVALSPDESFVVSSGADRTLRLWDVVGGRQLKQLATLDETMYSVVVHPDGQLVAAAGADRKVYLFNLTTGAIARTLEGHTDFIHCVAFNRAGTRLLSYGYAGQLRIWEPASGKLLLEKQIGRIGNYANYDTAGASILLSNGDGTARVFEVPTEAK